MYIVYLMLLNEESIYNNIWVNYELLLNTDCSWSNNRTQLNNIKLWLKIKNKDKLYLASHASLVCIQYLAQSYEQFCALAWTFYWSHVEF